MQEKNDDKIKEAFKAYCDSQSWCTFKGFSKRQYAVWDCSYYSADTKGNEISVIAELKAKHLYPSTDRDNWLLTTKKYEDLEVVKANAIAKDPTQQYSIQFVHIFPDGKIWIWCIDDVKNRKLPVIRNLPSNTYFGNSHRINTPVYLMNKFETILRDNIGLLGNN